MRTEHTSAKATWNVSSGRTSSAARLLVMMKKEGLELIRSFKLLWVPLVFILFGIMQPVVYYYMPIILKTAGNMPEGTIIEMPTPSGGQVLAETLGQYGTIGLLVLVLVFMGTVSGERNNGSAAMILVKPISVYSYLLSKWTSMLVLSFGSLTLGYLSSWYYTNLLIEEVAFSEVWSSLILYGLWVMFVLTVTLLFSTLLRSGAGAAFSALGLAVVLTLLSSLFPKQLGWSPGAVSALASQKAMGIEAELSQVLGAAGMTMALIAALLVVAVLLLRRSPAID